MHAGRHGTIAVRKQNDIRSSDTQICHLYVTMLQPKVKRGNERMFASLLKVQVRQTGDSNLTALCTSKFKEDKIPNTIQLDDLNHRGGFNDVSMISPHTANKEIQTVQ